MGVNSTESQRSLPVNTNSDLPHWGLPVLTAETQNKRDFFQQPIYLRGKKPMSHIDPPNLQSARDATSGKYFLTLPLFRWPVLQSELSKVDKRGN